MGRLAGPVMALDIARQRTVLCGWMGHPVLTTFEWDVREHKLLEPDRARRYLGVGSRAVDAQDPATQAAASISTFGNPSR